MLVEVDSLQGAAVSREIDFGVLSINADFRPSLELISRLSGLPEGSVVGVGICPLAEFELRDSVPPRYWSAILDVCGRRRLKPVFLDDWDLIEKVIECDEAADEKAELLQETGRRDIALLRESHAKEVERDYTNIVIREIHMLERIRETKPLVVIVSDYHADALWNSAVCSKYNVRFKAYSSERIPFVPEMNLHASLDDPSGLAASFYEMIGPNSFVAVPPHNAEALAVRASLVRKYHALTTGRVTAPSETPDFIGTWDRRVPAQGLFELIVTERTGTSWRGKVEDVYGSGSFCGIFDGDNVEFEMVHNAESVLAGAPKAKLVYKGKKNNGRYVGAFKNPKVLGEFEMKEFA